MLIADFIFLSLSKYNFLAVFLVTYIIFKTLNSTSNLGVLGHGYLLFLTSSLILLWYELDLLALLVSNLIHFPS